MTLPHFATIEDRLNTTVLRHLANSTVQLVGASVVVSAVYDALTPTGSPYTDVATIQQHSISACVLGMGGDVVEGSVLVVATRNWPAGQRCRITTSVEPDAGGWATFDVVPIDARG